MLQFVLFSMCIPELIKQHDTRQQHRHPLCAPDRGALCGAASVPLCHRCVGGGYSLLVPRLHGQVQIHGVQNKRLENHRGFPVCFHLQLPACPFGTHLRKLPGRRGVSSFRRKFATSRKQRSKVSVGHLGTSAQLIPWLCAVAFALLKQ